MKLLLKAFFIAAVICFFLILAITFAVYFFIMPLEVEITEKILVKRSSRNYVLQGIAKNISKETIPRLSAHIEFVKLSTDGNQLNSLKSPCNVKKNQIKMDEETVFVCLFQVPPPGTPYRVRFQSGTTPVEVKGGKFEPVE
jgi:hypothetical protein